MPLERNEKDKIKCPINGHKNVDYQNFCMRVEYILTIACDDVFDAATTYIESPDMEPSTYIIKLNDHENIFIGMVGDTPVGLIKHEINEECTEIVKDGIKQSFPNAKYVISVGLCFAFKPEKTNLGDVIISNQIIVFSQKNEKDIENDDEYTTICRKKKSMGKNISEVFCTNEDKVEGLLVSSNARRARHFVGSIASGPKIRESDLLEPFASLNRNNYGVEKVAGYLIEELQKNGIPMKDGTTKKIEVIAIKAVYGFVKEKGRNEWKFKAGQAAFNYISAKINKGDDLFHLNK